MQHRPPKIQCNVCPRHCHLAEGETGYCRTRKACNGSVISTNYGKLTSLALDPIEKKPLAHFMPQSMVLSAGSYGCNMRCPFCQNYQISQTDGATNPLQPMSPQQLVEQALALKNRGNVGIAFTYNEPGVGYEYVRDASHLAHQAGLKAVLVTNGYLCEPPFTEMLENLDALNIDLKCFFPQGYRRLGGQLDVVKHNIMLARQYAHVEVTTLIVPGLSDSEEDMNHEAAWLAGISPYIPLHISRYFPYWQAAEKATPVETVLRLAQVAGQHLKYVHTGNL